MQIVNGPSLEVNAVEPAAALVEIIKAGDEFAESCLASAAVADNGHDLAGLDV